MFKKIPQIREFMTPMPHGIGSDISVKKAREMMSEYQVRHLPVRRAGKVIGIISDRNIKELAGAGAMETLTAEDVMMPDPYHVSPETPLDEVAAAMAEEKYGCVVVEDSEKKLVGIFTTVDACRALRQILETHYPS